MGLSFIVEVAMWLAYGIWGFHHNNTALKWLLGIGLFVVSVVIWSIWAAPKSIYRLKQPGLLIFKSTLFILAGLGLLAAGKPGFAAAFLIFAAINQALEYYYDIRPTKP